MSTWTVSIDRSGLSLAALEMKGHADPDPSPLGIVRYTEPAMQPRIRYAPTSDYLHGEQPLAWAWQETMQNFDVATFGQATEADSRALIAELRAALTQFSYVVTVTADGAPSEAWTCRPGSLVPAGARTFADVAHHIPVWAVSIPCYPIRRVA